jgi:hopanoid biosynthesis associated RND transporter like protein HpnN
MRETAGDVGFSLLLCAATCVIGFLAFAPTDFVGVAELGVISAAGIVISLFASLTVLPALVTLLDPPLPSGHPRIFDSAAFARLVSFPVRRARAVRIGALALGAACAPFALGVRFDYNPLNLRVPDSDSVTAFNDLLDTEGASPWSAIVLAPDSAAAEATARELEALDVVDHTVTLSDYIPEDQEAKLAILEDTALLMAPPPASDAGKAPASDEDEIAALSSFVAAPASAAVLQASPALARLRESVARFLASLEGQDDSGRKAAIDRLERNVLDTLPEQIRRIDTALGAVRIDDRALPKELVRRAVAPDGRVRVDAFPREDISRDEAALLRFADTTVARVPTATGIALTNVESARAVMGAFREALLGASLAITLLLLVLWRRVSDTLVALAPLALASLVLTAIVVSLGMRFNFANVLVLPVLLGIGVDSGIHLVHRWRHADHDGDALLHTSTARGVIQSTLTTIASFGALALSIHPGLSSLGTLLTIGLVLILIANLVLIPALLANRRAVRS